MATDRENKQAKEIIQSDVKNTLEHCVSRVVADYPAGIWLMTSVERMGEPGVPTPQRCSAGCSEYCQSVLERGVVVKSNTTPNHNTGCRTSVAIHNTTVQQPLTTVFSNSNPTIVMLKARARRRGIPHKHNIVPFLCPCRSFITSLAAQTLVVSSQV
ncbi:hypothetical protein TNCV_1258901 [Trichonephila clavipes]|nr:hypothetical protein TNCV_1258901 [Trichonephila clavipes]